MKYLFLVLLFSVNIVSGMALLKIFGYRDIGELNKARDIQINIKRERSVHIERARKGPNDPNRWRISIKKDENPDVCVKIDGVAFTGTAPNQQDCIWALIPIKCGQTIVTLEHLRNEQPVEMQKIKVTVTE